MINYKWLIVCEKLYDGGDHSDYWGSYEEVFDSDEHMTEIVVQYLENTSYKDMRLFLLTESSLDNDIISNYKEKLRIKREKEKEEAHIRYLESKRKKEEADIRKQKEAEQEAENADKAEYVLYKKLKDKYEKDK